MPECFEKISFSSSKTAIFVEVDPGLMVRIKNDIFSLINELSYKSCKL